MNNFKTVQEITAALTMPFDPFDLEWRVQKNGEQNGKKWAMVLAYVTNRAIMDRLDEVFGIGGWQNAFIEMKDGAMICGIKCLVPVETELGKSYEWVTKYDGSEQTQIEAVKGSLSGAMKRAGVQWGIGRYLYNLETNFVTLEKGRPNEYQVLAMVKENPTDKYALAHHFERPKLPDWALPPVDES